jgi:RNA polymerase sigma-70 factor (ECF subfamily)
MDSDSGQGTSLSLLERLRQAPANQEAWERFVERYGRRIYGWCRAWHLQDADARDVTQMVLLKLARKMSSFVYDPAGSFRSWLKTVTQHALSDFVAESKQPGGGSGDSRVGTLLEDVEARADLAQKIEAEFDQELLDEAKLRVRQRVDSRTWEAFQLTALERQRGSAAAGQLGMTVAAVFKAKSRVQKMLQEEVRRLEGT